MQKIIGREQTGFMKGRLMLDDIKLLQVVIDLARQRGETLYVALLDQEKAYDSVDHSYLWKALSRVGVPGTTIEVIKGLYHNVEATVMVNKQNSRPFKLGRGVRQGDPLSCLLFNLVIEALSRMVKSDGTIKGIKDSKGVKYKISLFADDTALLFTDLNQWGQAKTLYQTYHKVMKLELGKRECLLGRTLS